jgi:polyisoprenoid-binding protein YceI
MARFRIPSTPPLAVLAALAALLCGPRAASAEPQVLRLNPQQTRITFTLDSALHEVHGTLALQEGEIRFDPATGEASGRLVIDARKAATGNSSRDAKMHSQVLESARYPLITFTPARVEGALPTAGSGRLQLHGTLVLHGASHPATLVATISRAGDRVTAATDLTVPYVQWGLKDPSLLLLKVSPKVDVHIEARGDLRPGVEAARGPQATAPPSLVAPTAPPTPPTPPRRPAAV